MTVRSASAFEFGRSRRGTRRGAAAWVVAFALLAAVAATGLTATVATPAAAAPIQTPRGSISVGADHTCAVTTAGGVRCWGSNAYGQLGNGTKTTSATAVDVTGLTSGVVAVAAGYRSTCAITAAGGVMCWGSNTSGVLGDGTTTDSTVPVAVTGLTDVVAMDIAGNQRNVGFGIFAEYNHACAVTSAGAVKCWGANLTGELGDGSTVSSRVPVQVVGLASGATAVAVGSRASCAIAAGGRAMCWGANTTGQLGDGTTTSSSVPVEVSGLGPGVRSIDTSSSTLYQVTAHSCAVTATGSVRCWGDNADGQLGDGTSDLSRVPVPVAGLGSGMSQVSVGTYSSCAVSAAGGATCWGSNAQGRLGIGSTAEQAAPTAVPGLSSGVVALTADYDHGCALTSTNAMRCWGENSQYELGNGGTATDSSSIPLAVVGLDASSVASIQAGYERSCVLTTSGGLKCWGRGAYGDGALPARQPVDVGGLTSGVASVSLGTSHSCIVSTAGAASCWGSGGDGRLGNGATTSSATPVAVTGLGSGVAAVGVGGDHTCALTTAGGVKCWGLNTTGQLGNNSLVASSVPVDVTGLSTGVSQISVGERFACALLTTGGVKCWGQRTGSINPDRVPVDVPSLTEPVASITTGRAHGCALLTTGGVKCWGANGEQQLGTTAASSAGAAVVPGHTSEIAMVSAGNNATCVVTTAGQGRCWGQNSSGNLGRGDYLSPAPPGDVVGAGSSLASIEVGDTHACGRTTAGVSMCWGNNFSGPLGAATANRSPGPAVFGLSVGPASVAGPTITGSRTPAANAQGWNNEPVVVSFECLSAALATCTAPSTVSTDGADQSVSGTATDLYGGSASDTVAGISIDRVAPLLGGVAATAPNAAGWYRSPVAMDWTCSDALSGVAPGVCPATSSTAGEGTAVSVSASASDRAGNLTTASSESVQVDLTNPSTGASSPPTWASTDVTLALSATDALSGVAETEYRIDGGPVQTGTSPVVSGQGTHTVEFWSTDVAGNEEAVQSVQVRIDVDAPSITAQRSVEPNAAGWNNGPVTVTFVCDAGSGSPVASCSAAQSFTTEVDTTVSGTAADEAGNTASVQVPVRIDLTSPTVTAQVPPANANGWFNAPVQVPFTCADSGGSGVASCPAPVVYAGDGADQAVTAEGTDAAGNTGTASGDTVSIDTTAPTISGAASGTPNGSGGYYGSVTVRWSCDDALSGVVACPADEVVSGEGTHTVTGSVTDRAGNTTSAQVPVRIDHDPSTDPGIVHGLVTSSTDSSPIPGAAVSLRTTSGAVVATTTTGTDGIYTFPTVPDGTYKLYVAKNGSHIGTYWPSKADVSQATSFTVVHGSNLTRNQALAPNPVLSGTVRTTGGTPISGATVRVGPSGLAAVTDSSGAYRITGLQPGSVTVNVVAYGMGAPAPASFALTGDRTHDVTMAPSAAGHGVKGTITNRVGGAARPGATVRVWPKGSAAIAMTVTTGANGRYSIADLPVGTYEIDVIGEFQVRWFGDVLSRANALPLPVTGGCTTTPDAAWGDPCAAPAPIRIG